MSETTQGTETIMFESITIGLERTLHVEFRSNGFVFICDNGSDGMDGGEMGMGQLSSEQMSRLSNFLAKCGKAAR